MTIGDVFEIKGKGVVVAGLNPELDALAASEVQAVITDRIVLEGADRSRMPAEVIGKEVKHACFTGQVNIFLLLPANTSRDLLVNGTRVLLEES